MKRNELCKKIEHSDRPGIVEQGGFGIDGAEGSEEFAAPAKDRDRYIALKTIHLWGMMVGEPGVCRDMVDDHGCAAVPYLVADRGFHLQLSAGLQTELDLIPDAAGDPAFFRDFGNDGKAHTGGTANDFEHGGEDGNTADAFDIHPNLFF